MDTPGSESLPPNHWIDFRTDQSHSVTIIVPMSRCYRPAIQSPACWGITMGEHLQARSTRKSSMLCQWFAMHEISICLGPQLVLHDPLKCLLYNRAINAFTHDSKCITISCWILKVCYVCVCVLPTSCAFCLFGQMLKRKDAKVSLDQTWLTQVQQSKTSATKPQIKTKINEICRSRGLTKSSCDKDINSDLDQSSVVSCGPLCTQIMVTLW